MKRDRKHVLPLMVEMQNLLDPAVLRIDHRNALLALAEKVLFHAQGLSFEDRAREMRRILAKRGAGWLTELRALRECAHEIEAHEQACGPQGSPSVS